jgi:hypothetical protein
LKKALELDLEAVLDKTVDAFNSAPAGGKIAGSEEGLRPAWEASDYAVGVAACCPKIRVHPRLPATQILDSGWPIDSMIAPFVP